MRICVFFRIATLNKIKNKGSPREKWPLLTHIRLGVDMKHKSMQILKEAKDIKGHACILIIHASMQNRN